MADKYAQNVDIVMLVMSSVLVVSSMMNEKIYNSAGTFKLEAGKPQRSPMTLGMTPEGVDKFSNVLGILGAAAAGSYGLSLVYKKGDAGGSKSPHVYTAVFGFAVSVALILSGVVSRGLYDQLATFKSDDKEKGAKVARDVNIGSIVLGSVAIVLMVVMVVKKKGGGGGAGFQFRSPLVGGGKNPAMSTFFTY